MEYFPGDCLCRQSYELIDTHFVFTYQATFDTFFLFWYGM